MGEINIGAIAGIVTISIVVIILYLIPTYIAIQRKHPNVLPIAIINIFLGWTYIGWVITLAWACYKIEGIKDTC
jgi:hypothetical protein